jgi:hypothetical protein
VKDYDVFYFDEDLSWEAEDAVIQHLGVLTNDLGVTVEIRNQARVHLWYKQRFGGNILDWLLLLRGSTAT